MGASGVGKTTLAGQYASYHYSLYIQACDFNRHTHVAEFNSSFDALSALVERQSYDHSADSVIYADLLLRCVLLELYLLRFPSMTAMEWFVFQLSPDFAKLVNNGNAFQATAMQSVPLDSLLAHVSKALASLHLLPSFSTPYSHSLTIIVDEAHLLIGRSQFPRLVGDSNNGAKCLKVFECCSLHFVYYQAHGASFNTIFTN